MQVSVLGATEVWRDGERVELGTRKRRALIAALALHAGHAVSVDGLVDLLWGDSPPDGVTGTLQVYVSGLRRALEPDRPPRAPATVLVTVAPGYALNLPDDALDAWRFDQTVTSAHRRLTGGATLTGEEYAAALADLDAALALWRGVPYVELDDHPQAAAERARLEEVRTVAIEDHAVAALALGDHGTVAAELEALTAAYPLRERLWALRALALTRSGRQADALDVLRRVREVLADELGLEPGLELRDLQTAILRQDPALAWTPPSGGPAAVPARQPVAHPPPDPEPSPVPPPSRPPSLPSWPLVGRDEQLAVLVAAYDRAEGGTPAFVALTGEPGIGKSRLCAELAAVAVTRGARLVVGRCSQDDGAPPLWPWHQALRGLGPDPAADADGEGPDDEGAEFRTWEGVVERVRRAATEDPVVLLLDDLHWADVPTLRVLRLLLETVEAGRLLVLATWRSHPEPTGALADVAEALARRHAHRLSLTGLSSADAAAVVTAVAEVAPTGEQAAQLAVRTDGNPFFLVEYARLAREGGDLEALMTGADPPTAVSDVLTRRLDRLPEESHLLLRWAAVIGREFELPVLAEAASVTEDDVLDRLDPVVESGLLREDGIGRYLFGHALVRDTVYAGFSATRRARAHARVAEVLEEYADRETEVARHWLAAGPAHAGRAWRAAAAAAAQAKRLHAYGTAAELLEEALAQQAADPAAVPRERYDLLMDLADAHRWQGTWSRLLGTAEQAIDVADQLGDVRLLGRASSATVVGAWWQSAPHGETNERILDGLRRALVGLPVEDDELRCRVMLGLALELYYTASFEERSALVEQALAMARRLGDEGLVLDACEAGYVAVWRPDTAVWRLELATEAMELATRTGNERAFVGAATLRAIVLNELGGVDQMWEVARIARDRADHLRLPYALIILDTIELPWLAMADRFAEAEERLASIQRIAPLMAVGQTEQAAAGGLVSLRLWQGRVDEVMDILLALEGGPLPATSVVLVAMVRAGDLDRARAHAATHTVQLEGEDWFSQLNWACAAEAALALGDAGLAAAAYARLAPLAGRNACAGSGNAMGPMDAFLALAAAGVGDRALAARHADDAVRMMEEWQVPLAAQWLRDQRARYGF